MTLTEPTKRNSEGKQAGIQRYRGLTSWARTAWSASLAVHAVALLVLMVAVASFIGTGATFTDDEGAGILQAQAIEHGHWTMANPLPSIDPTGAAYPLTQATRGTKGTAPLGAHLVYFVVLALFGLALGSAGMVGLSIAGTVAAALLAARLARDLGASERATFWLVGVASPLFFDGFLVVAHTVAAALVAGSALLGLRFLRTGRIGTLVGAIICVGGASLLRTEAVLWAVGFAAGVLTATVGRGARQGSARRGLTLATGSTALMVAAWKANAVLTHQAIGSAVSAPAGAVPGTSSRISLHDQVLGLLRSWFNLSGSPAAAFVIIIVVLALAAVWARAARRGRAGSRSTLALVGALAAFPIYLAVSQPNGFVAGIAIVFPLLWAGLWLLGKTILRDPARRLLVVSSATYALLVAASEYADGGAWEPGRYFFLAIPVIVPVVVLALADPLRRLAPKSRVVAVACVVLAIGATTTSAVSSLRSAHQVNGGLAVAVRAAASDAPPGDGGLPVAVTTYSFLPRTMWATFPHIHWQLVRGNRLAAYGAALLRGGIHRFVLVTADPGPEVSALRASYTAVKTEQFPLALAWRVIVLQQT